MTSEKTPRVAGYAEKTPYENWMVTERIPIVTGYSIGDLREVSLEPWPRRGGRGAFINLIADC